MNQLYAYLSELNTVSIIVRMLFAVVSGGIIGFERGRRNRPAGLRTHMLVCLGSALAMMINQYIVQNFDYSTDPARLGAQVISGIGFLGAGTIIVTSRRQVKGLTTAAGLWASACMGLAIGVGFYTGALIGCVFIVLIITFLNRFDKFVRHKSKFMSVIVAFDSPEYIPAFIELLKSRGYGIEEMDIARSPSDAAGFSAAVAMLDINLPTKQHHTQTITELSSFDGVRSVEEI